MSRTHVGLLVAAMALCGCVLLAQDAKPGKDGFVSLFNGKDLSGWKPAKEKPDSFKVKDGVLVVDGGRSHLFYVGEDGKASFKNFEFKAEVKTFPGANGGIYFHTAYQKAGWPKKGYEAQVNNSHKDPRKTGSLYAIQDVEKAPAEDGKWFEYHIIVQGKKITIKIDGKTLVEYTEPDNPKRKGGFKDRLLDEGTFAIQAHDPKSKAMYRNIQVKRLP
ncbi:MAG: DUF1080 domain-containing protein [Phycisphaeraceae bacterium]|nr:DUF1080 domain-containing protein [Phycisphaeraceae bacterium]